MESQSLNRDLLRKGKNMKTQIEITDSMIEKSINQIVRSRLDEYFGKDAWAQYGNYNDVIERVVLKRLDDLLTEEKIIELLDKQKDYIVTYVSESIADRIAQSMCND